MDDPLVEKYLEHMTDVDRTPANTVKSRIRTLRSVGHPGTATREDIELWWAARAELAPATRQNDLSNLRGFYRWCQVWEHRHDDPTTRLSSPKVPNGVPTPISRADLLRVLEHVKEDDQLRRAFCLGAYGGLRVAEAAALHWHDVDLETRRMRILGKGQKTRLVALSGLLVDQLLPVTGANVVTGTDHALTPNALQRAANRAMRAAGVEATFHWCRHRYGTLGYQATGDLLAVGRQMGHASPVTTSRYAAASDEMADKIADAVCR